MFSVNSFYRYRYALTFALLLLVLLFVSQLFHNTKPLNPSILCLINTSKKELLNRAVHINATWAQRCDKALFLSYDEDITLPFLDLKVPETRQNLWNKWRAAFQWIFENEIENFDFFIRADDDSYIVMENLKAFLSSYNPNEAFIFGTPFKLFVKTGYPSGGPGIIFTREALKQFVKGMYKAEICREIPGDADDMCIGAFAEALNITKIDTRDNRGRLSQLPWSPEDHFGTGLTADQLSYLSHPYNQSFECCADYIISFHYVYKESIYTLEFVFYKAKKV